MLVKLIFELSNYPAVGIMIYGSPIFENVPMESLIKHFRDECDISKMDSLIDVKDDLLDFMLVHTQNTDFKALMESHLHEFKNYIEPKLSNLNYQDSLKYLNYDIIEIPSFLDNFSDIIDSFDDFFIDLVPSGVDESNVEKFADCLKNVFLDYVLNMGTGVVIAGFTKKDLYPSVISFIASLNYHDDSENTDKIGIIDYAERLNIKGNAIFLYAQKDVIQNFLTGISGDMDKHIVNYLRDTLNNLLNDIKEYFNTLMRIIWLKLIRF